MVSGGSDHIDIRELFLQLSKGDHSAFTELFYHYTPRLYPFILKKVKDPSNGKRNQKYLALIRTSQEDKIASKSNTREVSADKFSIRVQYYGMNTLVGQLAQPLQLYPTVIDETNYQGKIDIELNCKIGDLNALNEELAKYDLQLVEKKKGDGGGSDQDEGKVSNRCIE